MTKGISRLSQWPESSTVPFLVVQDALRKQFGETLSDSEIGFIVRKAFPRSSGKRVRGSYHYIDLSNDVEKAWHGGNSVLVLIRL